AAWGTALRAIRPGREELADVGRHQLGPATKTRPRLHNAAVERREASALRHWARDASQGVSRVPRQGTQTVRRTAPAPLGATPPRPRGTRRKAPPGALRGRKTGRPGGGALASPERSPDGAPALEAGRAQRARAQPGYDCCLTGEYGSVSSAERRMT